MPAERPASSPPAPERRSVRMRSASWLLMAQVASLLASFPTSVLLARALGASGKGMLSVVQLIATFGAVLFNFGIGQAMTYFSARREARGRDAVLLSLAVSLGMSGTLALLSIPFGSALAAALHVDEVLLVRIGLVITGPVLAGQFLNAYVVGSGAIRNASFVNVGSLVFQLATLSTLLVTHALTPEAAVVVWAVAVTGVAGVFSLLAWGGEADETVELGARRLMRRIWRYGIAAWPGGILGSAAQRFDVFLLAYFRGPAEVGIYSIAVTLAELCWYVPNALGGVLIPKVAAEREDGLQVSLRLGRVTWVVTAVTALGVLVVGGPLIPFVFGREFGASVWPLALILPGIVISSTSTASGAYLAGIGHPLDITKAAGANVVANVIANVLLMPRFGAAGAAMSSAISYTVAVFVQLHYFKKRSGARLRDLLVPRVSDFTEIVAAARRTLSLRRAERSGAA